MRVALIDPSLYTTPYDSALIGGLQKQGCTVRLFGRQPRSTDVPLEPHVDLEPVFYQRSERWRRGGGQAWVRFAKAFEHFLSYSDLEKALRAFAPDVVHWQWPSVPAFDIAFLRKLRRHWPQIVTVHDTNLFHRTGLGKIRTLGWNRFIGSADQVIVHLESSRQVLRGRGVPTERVNVVKHGVFDRPADSGNVEPLARGDKLRVLFFGRITINKGIHTLIEAVAMLPEDIRRRIELHVAGALRVPDAQWRALLDKASLGDTLKLRAEFVPEAELDALIAAADIVVFPHLDVDASGALMKTAAYDTAIVASDIPSFVETIGDSGAAEFFRVDQPASLAETLRRLIVDEDARRRLRAEVAKLRSGELSWPVLGARTIEVYRRALQRGRS